MHTYGESFAFCIVQCGWCEPSASRSGHLTPMVTGTCWIVGWVGIRAGLYCVVRRLVIGLVTASEHHGLLAFKAEDWIKDRKWSRRMYRHGALPNSAAAAAVGIAVCIATRYWLNCPGIESRWERDIPHPSWPALRFTLPPVQCTTGHSRR
jgi:hypothetical protein